MRIMLSMVLAATTIGGLSAVPADAQTPRQEYRRDVREAQRDYRRDLREARQDARRDQRDWRQFRNYDYNRLPRGQRSYYADNYYRDGRYYQPRRLTRNDRIYRGRDNRYYCRRSDGTTGLIIGGIGGGVLGSLLANGGSNTLGALIGAGAGAALGTAIDRGNVTCR